MTWDIKWTSKSFIANDYYTTEWKIPMSAFRYREGETKWRFGSYQRDSKNTSWNMWHKVPEDQDFSDMAFLGDMYFEKPLKKSKLWQKPSYVKCVKCHLAALACCTHGTLEVVCCEAALTH